MVGSLLEDFGIFLTVTFAVEFTVIALIKEDAGGYKFRLVEWFKDRNLEHYQRFVTVSAVVILSAGLVNYLLSNIFYSDLRGWIQSFSAPSLLIYDAMLFLVIVIIATYYSRGKKMDKELLYLASAVIVLVLVFGQLNYGILNGFL